MSSDQARISQSMADVKFPFLAVIVCLATPLCYVTAKLAGVLALRPQMIWPLWPGCALLVAVLLLVPRRIWPLLIPAGLAGFVLYDLQAGLPIRSTALLILADTIEVLIAGLGISYSFDQVPCLNSVKALAKYSLFAVILAPASAAFVGAVALGGEYWISWRISFLTEALSLLTLTPAILSWFNWAPEWAHKSRAYYFEATVLIAGLFSWAYVTFAGWGSISRPVLLYSLVPFLLWSALRFGSIGISMTMIVVAFLSVWGAVHSRGPFVGPEAINNVLSLQLFLFVTATPFMVLAALVEERKRADAVLRESEQRFRLVTDTAPVLIWMSGPDQLCSYFNKPWLEFTGRPLGQELGNGWAEGVHPEDLTACLDTYNTAFEGRQSFKMQYRLRRHDGEYRWVLDIATPRFSGDSFAGYIGSCIDITDHKLAEVALSTVGRRLIEAQEQERSRIARELHDDINQRLALLANGLQEFEQNATVIQEPLQKKKLRDLWQLTDEIATDIQQMSHRLHPSKLHYLGLAAAVRDLCNEFSQQYKIAVECVVRNLPQDLEENASLSLFRTVQESLRNVVKHSRARHVKVEFTGEPAMLQLRVSDDGVGFDPADAHNHHGLGLVSMRERLRSLGGEFSIWSKQSLGTQVEVRVPATRKPVRKTDEPAA